MFSIVVVASSYAGVSGRRGGQHLAGPDSHSSAGQLCSFALRVSWPMRIHVHSFLAVLYLMYVLALKNISSQALNSLRLPQGDDLAWHPVSVEVGNVKHQDINLIKRTELAKVCYPYGLGQNFELLLILYNIFLNFFFGDFKI